MPDEGTRQMQAMWVASTLHPERRVAQPTLAALLRLLRLNQPAPGVMPASGTARALHDVPALGAVGGIARMEGPDGEVVGVARVGRASFVGFRLTDDSLDEVEVALDELTGRLSIGPSDSGDTAQP
jgi:hypothetical protein